MKKIYEKPAMQLEEFIPNECVAACGDTEYGKYKFNCNAGNYDGFGYIYQEMQGNGQFDHGNYGWGANDRRLGGFGPCNIEHEADTTDEFIDGWYVPCDATYIPREDAWDVHTVYYDQAIPVIIWRGDDGNGLHATSVLDRDSWPVVKS